ncbi:hypothetical protein NQ176_g8002 [Zarea fungicola]|uniref:Uncharacterized protein n=1 Tax=Zarea fungicola TaxID=93591 RepID=A0ACC1MUX9_9HYPO|nr:hypothetical protein NQ176_g8002 [Lecanicillium fungicola]
MEIIEYLEELTDLVKLLVGVNAFRRGMLETPNHRQYIDTVEGSDSVAPGKGDESPATNGDGDDEYMDVSVASMIGGTRRSRAATVTERPERWQERVPQHHWGVRDIESGAGRDDENAVFDEEDVADIDYIPVSLQRVGTRLRQSNAAVRSRRFTTGG